MEILVNISKEINDKKIEIMKKKRKRDIPKINLLKVFSRLVANNILRGSMNDNTAIYYKEFMIFMDSIMFYISNASISSDIEENMLYILKSSFMKTLGGIADEIYYSQMTSILNGNSRNNFFSIISSWFGYPLIQEPLKIRCAATLTSLVQSKSFLLDNSGIMDRNILELLEMFILNDKTVNLALKMISIVFEIKPDVNMLIRWIVIKCLKSSSKIYETLLIILGEYFERLKLLSFEILILPLFLVFSESENIQVLYTARNVINLIIQSNKNTNTNENMKENNIDYIHYVGVDAFKRRLNKQVAKLLASKSYDIINTLNKFFTICKPSLKSTILLTQCEWLENIEFRIISTISPSYVFQIQNQNIGLDNESSITTETLNIPNSFIADSNKVLCGHLKGLVLISNLFYITHKVFIIKNFNY